jgi:SAM-dependent methyltransferase
VCNQWCLDFTRRALPHVSGRPRVLEVGSLDVNGSVRTDLGPLAASYVGIDIRPGPGVDAVLDVGHVLERFGPSAFDLVASTEMLEHCPDWAGAVFQMLSVLGDAGLLLLTTRSPGFPLHDHPGDHWRFTAEDVRSLLEPLGHVLELESDFSLGWPCGIGVVFRKAAGPPALQRWLEDAHRRPLRAVDPVRDAFTEVNSHLTPFHDYSAYRACAAAVRALHSPVARVLDVSERTASLLPLVEDGLEVTHHPLARGLDATARYDAVVAVDTIHRLAPDARARVLETLARSGDTVVVAGPADDEGGRRLHRWLAAEDGVRADSPPAALPTVAELSGALAARGLRVQVLANGHVTWLLPLLDLWRWHRGRPAVLEQVRAVVARCSRLLAPFDDLEPAARRVVVATRAGTALPAPRVASAADYREAAQRWAECWDAARPLFGGTTS